MKQDFFYCSELSREVREQPFGTASTADAWLLLEYSSAWGARAFQESQLTRAVKEHLKKALQATPRSRLLFIKQERASGNHLSLFIVRSTETDASIVRLKLSGYEQLLDITLAGILAGKQAAGAERWERPLFLVCTHGKRDKCCAKFGYALYKSLRSDAGDDVWQSSHVGGDRFAANLICFPHGFFYAHVTADAGRQIISQYNQQTVSLINYRGRCCYPSPIQAAEFFLRSESGLNGINDVRFLDYVPITGNHWLVRFLSRQDSQTYEIYLRSRISEFQNPLTCQAREEKQVVQYSLSDYRLISQPSRAKNT
ncbi:MAG TPA: sucrase ferredoxin [Pyrinomonadaceae bacterium]